MREEEPGGPGTASAAHPTSPAQPSSPAYPASAHPASSAQSTPVARVETPQLSPGPPGTPAGAAIRAGRTAGPPDPDTQRAGGGRPQPAPAEAPVAATLVIEEGPFQARLRRPRDLLGALVAVLAASLMVGLAYTAERTNRALDSDLQAVQDRLPEWVALLINALAGLGLILLPVASAAGMLIRRRGRQLLDSIAAMTLATTLLAIIASLILNYGPARLNIALTGVPAGYQPTYPANAILGGLVAFVTTARLLSRPRWNVIVTLIIGSAAFVTLVSQPTTAAAQAASIALGAAVGLLARYVLGTPTTRPSGTDVATTLVNAGFPLVMLRARGGTDAGRRYQAVTSSGEHLDVLILDRDLEGAGVGAALWRSIRLRESDIPVSDLSMRTELERSALLAYAAQVAGVPSPKLRVAAMVSADAALMAYEAAPGRIVAPTAVPQSDAPTDAELDAAWRAVVRMQAAMIAHRHLAPGNVSYSGAATQIVGLSSGAVAASDVSLRIDLAEMLITQALQTDTQRAVASARRVLGDEAILRALPVLQKVALSPETRAALRARRGVLTELREALLDVNPQIDIRPINLERVRPRTLITVILGTVAGYVLLSQLAQVDLRTMIATADWGWAIVALVLSMLTYVGATLAISGFVPERLRFLPTLMAQFAASFATLVSPPTLGAVAVNGRFLNRVGLPPAAAAATIGVSQIAAFVVHVTLLLVVGVAAGTQADLDFNPPRAAVITIGVIALIIGSLASVSAVRVWLADRIRPMVDQVVPRLITVAQRPPKLAEGFGGILLLNVAYCLCLVAAVRAFSPDLTIAAISFVYLAGSTLGQAAPTPGGLGVVEAALAAGLTAAGLESGIAVSAVLLFRLLTFWAPTVPGWFAFRHLTGRELL